MKNDKVSEPEARKFECGLVEFNEGVMMKVFDNLSYSSCTLKSVPTDDAKSEAYNLHVPGMDPLPFAEMGFGLFDKARHDKYYPKKIGEAQELFGKLFEDLQISNLYLINRTVLVEGVYVDKFYAIKFKEDHYTWFQSLVANGIQVNSDHNLTPFFPYEDTVPVHYIIDETRTFSEEGYLKDYFTESFVGVNGSGNYFLDLTKNRLDLLNNYMYFNNKTVSYNLSVGKDFLDLKDRTTSEIVEKIDYKSIYKCAVWHNVVPFSLNPLDSSWCGFAFPYGHRSEANGSTIKYMYIEKTESNTECIMLARALQKTIYENCSNDDKELHNEIFAANLEKSDDADKFGGKKTGDDGKVVSDTDQKPGEEKVEYKVKDLSADLLDDLPTEQAQLFSQPVHIKEPQHGPSHDRDNFYNLDKVLYSLLINVVELDPKIYYSEELISNHSHNHKYRPFYIEQPDQIKLFNEELDRISGLASESNGNAGKDTARFVQKVASMANAKIPVQTTEGPVIQIYKPDPAIFPKSYLNFDHKFMRVKALKLAKKSDKLFNNKDLVEHAKYWGSILRSKSIPDVDGRGPGLNYSDVYYQQLLMFLQNDSPDVKIDNKKPPKGPGTVEVYDYYWYRLEIEKKKGIVRKVFKTQGKPNGDVLEQQYDCCAILTTAKGAMVVTVCSKAMKFKSTSETKFFDLYSKEIEEKEFNSNMKKCGPAPEPHGDAMAIKQLNGTIVIPSYKSLGEEQPAVTTIKDGKIIKDDGHSVVEENLLTGATVAMTKPGEKVTVTPVDNNTAVNEKVQDKEGNVLSDKKLVEADQTVVDESAEGPTDCDLIPNVIKTKEGLTMPNPEKENCEKSKENDIRAQELAAAKTKADLKQEQENAASFNKVAEGVEKPLPANDPQETPEVSNVDPKVSDPNSPPISPEAAAAADAADKEKAAATAAEVAAKKDPKQDPKKDPSTPPNQASLDPNSPNFDPSAAAAAAAAAQGAGDADKTDPSHPANPKNKNNRTRNPENPKEEDEQDPANVNKPGQGRRPAKQNQIEIIAGNSGPHPPDVIVRDLGYYDIYIDRENKVTVHSKKDGSNKDKLEKVQNAYRLGDIVYIYFTDGSYLKHYLVTGETAKIYNDKNIVAHFYPDSSYVYDDKNSKLRHINNKYGIKATFDLKGNKFLNKNVKQFFRYGSDIVYVMNDDTVIVKKESGESLILNPDESLQVLDKYGKVNSQEDFRFKVRYNLTDRDETGVKTYDNISGKMFRMWKDSKLSRVDGEIIEILPKKIKLNIMWSGNNWYKMRYSGNFEERCYQSHWGVRFDKNKSDGYLCKCSDKYLVEVWSCEHMKSRAKVFDKIIKELKRKRLWHYEQKAEVDKFKLDYDFMRMLRNRK